MRQNVNDGSVDLGNALAPYARRARPLPLIGFKRGTDNLTLRHQVSAPLLSIHLRVSAQATPGLSAGRRDAPSATEGRPLEEP